MDSYNDGTTGSPQFAGEYIVENSDDCYYAPVVACRGFPGMCNRGTFRLKNPQIEQVGDRSIGCLGKAFYEDVRGFPRPVQQRWTASPVMKIVQRREGSVLDSLIVDCELNIGDEVVMSADFRPAAEPTNVSLVLSAPQSATLTIDHVTMSRVGSPTIIPVESGVTEVQLGSEVEIAGLLLADYGHGLNPAMYSTVIA